MAQHRTKCPRILVSYFFGNETKTLRAYFALSSIHIESVTDVFVPLFYDYDKLENSLRFFLRRFSILCTYNCISI